MFLSATKIGNWVASQAVKAKMLPILLMSNQSNYAKYMAVQLLAMKRLPSEVKEAFDQGLFVAKLAEGRFNAVMADYALEVTENKALKGTGVIIGLTLKGNALARFFLSRPVSAKYSCVFHEEVCLGRKREPSTTKQHHTSRPGDMMKWNSSVEKMNNLFETSYIDPFDINNAPRHLVNFATGAVARKDIQDAMKSYTSTGECLATKFVEERLAKTRDNTTTQKSFYDPMPRQKPKTMKDMHINIKVKSQTVALDNDIMYRRLLAMNEKKKVLFRRVMSFENSSVPMSLFKVDGSLALPNSKSDFGHKLEELLETKIETMAGADCVIYDSNAIIRILSFPRKEEDATFKDLASDFTAFVFQRASQIGSPSQIHLIFDRYYEESVKTQTRLNRGDSNDQAVEYNIVLGGRVHVNKDAFLSSSSNKAALARVYTEYLSSTAILPQGLAVFASGGNGNHASRISTKKSETVPELESNHEESDTRIILHCIYAVGQGATKIVVQSPDTDILVLLLHHYQAINCAELYLLTGSEGKHTNLTRFIPVHELFRALRPEQHAILLPVYCLSGCDTTSLFVGHGKRTAFKVKTVTSFIISRSKETHQ